MGRVLLSLYTCELQDTLNQNPCLLGTHAVGPLGLMCPAVGVEPRGRDDRSNSACQLLHLQRVPSQKRTFLEAHIETSVSTPCTIVFEPNRGWMALMGVEVEDSMMLKVEFGYTC